MSHPDDPTFYEVPGEHHYGVEDLEAFEEDLRRQDVNLLFVPIDRYDQLELDETGRTMEGGRRFSSLAFRQLCSLLGPSLSRLLVDLAANTGQGDDRNRASMDDAVRVYNILLRRRFSAMDGRLLLIDTQADLVEGAVSGTYQKLSNWDMYVAMRDKLRDWRRPEEFHSARVRGRHMMCVFRNPEPTFILSPGDEFHSCVVFSNSENGDASVRATTALMRSTDGTRLLRPYARRCRITHTGANFRRRLERLLEACVERAAEELDYREWFADSETRTLGFTGDFEYNESRLREITRALMARELPKALARRVVRRAVTQEASGTRRHEDPRYFRESDWQERSYFHLISALMVEAAEAPMHVRSRTEQLAYSVLTGRIKF